MDDLPPEMILQIAAFLAESSVTCLALCNKKLRQKLGQTGFETHRVRSSNPYDFKVFLMLLSRDLPDQFTCLGCCRLHKNDAVSRPYEIAKS
jgi:hypothetical protein